MRLEWIEIYNQSDVEIDLGGFILIADSDINELPAGILLNPKSYAVLARQALPENGSDSFERLWGDSSGVWGDSDNEDYLLLDINMSLNNGSGNAALADLSLIVLDNVSWNVASDDGRSIERNDVNDYNSGWHDCYDPDRSTPGRDNSLIPEGGEDNFYVEMNRVVISRSDADFNDLQIDLVIPPATTLSVGVFDETGYKVKSLLNDSDISVLQLSWDGKSDDGCLLAPGIYIISFIVTGQQNESKYFPVVIAP